MNFKKYVFKDVKTSIYDRPWNQNEEVIFNKGFPNHDLNVDQKNPKVNASILDFYLSIMKINVSIVQPAAAKSFECEKWRELWKNG